MPYEIRSGEVLTTGAVHNNMDNNNNSGGGGGGGGNKKNKTGGSSPTNSKGFFKRLLRSSKSKSKAERDLKYLQCFDRGGQEVMIPLLASGVFSPVGDATTSRRDAVYELKDLIKAFDLPVNVQAVDPSPEGAPPLGVLRLYGTREEEVAVLSKGGGTAGDASLETVQVSLDRDLRLQRRLGGCEQCPQNSETVDSRTGDAAEGEKTEEGGGAQPQVELPKRVSKQLKKFKSTGFLDKLSVRTVRRERAKLKEMRTDDVFSKRVVRHDLTYEDFFKGLDRKEAQPAPGAERNSGSDSSTLQSDTTLHRSLSNTTTRSDPRSNSCSRKSSLQNRDLPPIPVPTPRASVSSQDYEALPLAPTPPPELPQDTDPFQVNGDYDDFENDGYMVPRDVQGEDSAYSSSNEVQLRQKPVGSSKSGGKVFRSKKCHSELLPIELHSGTIATDDGRTIDIDELFSSTYSKKHSERSSSALNTAQWAGSTSQLYGLASKGRRCSEPVNPAWQPDPLSGHGPLFADVGRGGSLSRRSGEKVDLLTTGGRKGGYRSHLSATLRSHNLRGGGRPKPTIMELFHFTDSFRDLRPDQPSVSSLPEASAASAGVMNSPSHLSPFPAMRVSRSGETGRSQVTPRRGDAPYGATYSSPTIGSAVNGASGPISQSGLTYTDSDPLFQKLDSRSPSLHGLNDSLCPTQGDDSAISVGYRGDNLYSFNNDSELSFQFDHGSSGNLPFVDDGWSPPDDLSGLSVQEVSRSLRYIGMKDRVVLRFAHEQIDGSMLCSLDKRLLKEGFPELNALEVKKILDFVRGWRPKKR